jgi:hypothetical protein
MCDRQHSRLGGVAECCARLHSPERFRRNEEKKKEEENDKAHEFHQLRTLR